jgi:hypothetical protein
MDARLWLWVSLAIGLVTAVGACLTAPRGGGERGRPWWVGTPAGWLALATPLAGFLVTLPAGGKVFAAGHGLGNGLLIGGIAGLLFAFVAARRTEGETDGNGAAFALAAAATAIPLLFLRPVLVDALFGVALGWFAVSAILYFAVNDEAGTDRAPLVFGAGVVATLAAAAALGALRDERTPELARGTWSALVVLFAAGGGLIRLALGLLRPSSGAGRAASPAVAVGLLAVLGLLAATRAANDIRLFSVLAAGLLLWPVVVWVNRSGSLGDTARATYPLPVLPMLLLAGGFMLSGQLLLGYGAAVWLLGVLLSAAALWPSVRPTDPVRAAAFEAGELRLLLFGAVLVLFRTAQGRWAEDLRAAASLSDHYALFGLLVGVAAPAIASAAASGIGGRMSAGARPVARAVVAGLLTLALPAGVVVLFGPKCVLALLLGVALGALLGEGLTASLLAVGVALAVVQLLGRALPLADLTRPERLQALGLLVGLIAVVVFGARWKGTMAATEVTSEGERL